MRGSEGSVRTFFSGDKGINPKMLLEQLKELIEFGMVDKKTFESYPLKVEYFLTKRGKSILEALTIWLVYQS
ncbi:helix-turn-helix transcriptional regulator [Clostridium sp. DJ247]|nr:helix-turn-helix transcriptional regulator [Clostridium sp. DJ247]